VFYGVDSFKMGQQLAKETLTFMGTKGTVILVSGGPGATNLNARLAGAKDVLKKYAGIRLLGPYFHHDDLAQAQELTNSLLAAHPNAGAILMVAGVPFFGKMSGLPRVIKNHGKVKIITTDVLAPELPFVKQGLVQALVGQDYWGWGYQSTTICYNLLTNKSCKYPSLVPQAMPVVTRANVDAWIARWKQAATPAGAAKAFKEAPIGCGM
jgi:ABC-type sugar transport system substrate-binding protein